MPRLEVLESPSAEERLGAAADFLASVPPGDEVLVLGSSRDAVDELVRALSQRSRALFGVHRFTLTQLAARLAAPELARQGLAMCTPLTAEAVAARAVHAALGAGSIPYFSPVAGCPGFARSVASTLRELREAAVEPSQLAAAAPPGKELAELLEAFELHLTRARLADRARLLVAAVAAVGRAQPDALVGCPLLMLDVPLSTRLEADLAGALLRAARRALATVPVGDDRTLAALSGAATHPVTPRRSDPRLTGLARLQRFLFNESEEPPAAAADDSVRFFSAPGEGRETTEIARWVLAEARRGTRFDRMIVYLRNPQSYTPLLETAFRRAGIPACFARGTRRPHPAGRAFLALLGCAAEGLSASRFAEYLSFGQVPATGRVAGPSWVGPRHEVLAAADRTATSASDGDAAAADETPADGGPRPVPAPWKWEQLLVDAAVVGGAERWQRRIAGLARELELQHEAAVGDDPDAERAAALERTSAELRHLAALALPVIAELASWPAQARWGEWRALLEALAPAVLHRPVSVQHVLAELAPMDDVGPVGLDEVRSVLAERLAFLSDDPPAYRYGHVLVTTLDDARGRVCDVAFVPGLAERILPQRPREDPLLLDALRGALSPDLIRQDGRVDRERLLLRLAVGSATRRLYVSYPRLDVGQGRPRVISFYGLDVARATRGGIPGLEPFEREAAVLGNARLAWPAPPDPADAIDAAEHDLAVLARLIHAPPGTNVTGAAQYLVELNPHLARSLRTRYARWEARWSERDGMVKPTPAAVEVLATHGLSARPYSPSALERFAICPYRFFLAAIHRLRPRRTVAPLEQLDPLTRGRLFHRVQAETLRALAAEGALPVRADGLVLAERVLATTLERVARVARDELAPAIDRVWQDGIDALGNDLIHWLRQLARDADRWHPAYFELGFGLALDRDHDPNSRPEPVIVGAGVRLRGSVDLVERAPDGQTLRVTDHKTGANRARRGQMVCGGEVLQPVLYGLAVEALLQAPVAAARLAFCTERGGFTEHEVALDARARATAHQVLSVIDRAIARGFFPPAPAEGACAACDFHLICGPHEAERIGRKDAAPLADLAALRALP